jgi:hypothetical protein
MNRRARLLRFLAPWTVPSGGYEVRVGSTRLSPEILTDDALEVADRPDAADGRPRSFGVQPTVRGRASRRRRLVVRCVRFTAGTARLSVGAIVTGNA